MTVVRNTHLPMLHCYRCAYTWTARRRHVRACARCKSKLWDEPRFLIPRGGGGLNVKEVLGPYRSKIERLGRKFGASEIRVFGSVARGSASARSDLDLLVVFDRTKQVRSTLRAIDFGLAVEKLIGRRVQVATPGSLHWFIEPQVVAESVPL